MIPKEIEAAANEAWKDIAHIVKEDNLHKSFFLRGFYEGTQWSADKIAEAIKFMIKNNPKL